MVDNSNPQIFDLQSYDKEKHQILIFEKLKQANICSFPLENDRSIIN